MRKYITALMILILIMALIPIAANDSVFSDIFSKNGEQAVSRSIISSTKNSGYPLSENITFLDLSTEKNVSRSAKAVVYALVGAAVGEEFSENEIKALTIAYHTQLRFESDSDRLAIDTKDSQIFLSENSLKEKFGKNYTTFCSYCDNVFGSLILKDGKPMNLNILFLSNTPESNPEISLTAAPYNLLSKNYSTDMQCDSSDHLTASIAHLMSEQGNTYHEILNYYYS